MDVGGDARIEAACLGEEFPGYFDGRRDFGAGGLGEDADPSVVMRVSTGWRKGVEDDGGCDASFATSGQFGGDRGAEDVDLANQNGIDVRVVGVRVGGQDKARAVGLHLMEVEYDVRMPAIQHVIDGGTRLDLGQHEP